MFSLISRWWPVVFWCLVIFVFSSLPTIETSEIYWWDFILKKTAHVTEFGILYFLVFKAIKKSKINIIIAFLFCIFYAITDEYHQSFVPGRTATLRDIGFDAFGALAAFLKTRKLYG